jgi:hypothetical protein
MRLAYGSSQNLISFEALLGPAGKLYSTNYLGSIKRKEYRRTIQLLYYMRFNPSRISLANSWPLPTISSWLPTATRK